MLVPSTGLERLQNVRLSDLTPRFCPNVRPDTSVACATLKGDCDEVIDKGKPLKQEK
jgi:hypothetical protein